MARKRSNRSQLGSSPIISRANATPDAFEAWLCKDQPYTIYNPAPPSQSKRPASKSPQTLKVSTFDVDEYLRLQPQEAAPSPSISHKPSHRRISSNLSISSSQRSPSYLASSPLSLRSTASDWQTNPTSVSMSRQSSIAGSSFCAGLDMMRLNSHMSNVGAYNEMHAHPSQPKFDAPCSPIHEQASTLDLSSQAQHYTSHVGGILTSADLSSALELPSTSFGSFNEPSSDMHRTSSSDSSGSTTKMSRRSHERAMSKSQLIAPKEEHASPMSISISSSSDHEMIRKISADGSYRDAIKIEKTPYVRPIHEKVKCKKCNKKPDGYRGDHELRRHMERAHGQRRKVWVCVEPSKNGTFLSKCKACTNKKRYNAYYNAAAHLRRTHFNERPKGRKGRTLKPEERRGGKGGGHWPPMTVLRDYMTSFMVDESDESAKAAIIDNDDADESELLNEDNATSDRQATCADVAIPTDDLKAFDFEFAHEPIMYDSQWQVPSTDSPSQTTQHGSSAVFPNITTEQSWKGNTVQALGPSYDFDPLDPDLFTASLTSGPPLGSVFDESFPYP